MSGRWIESAAIAALVMALGAGATSAPREKPKVLRLPPSTPPSTPRPQGMTPEQRGEKLGMGLGVLVCGVGVVGYWVLKSRRDD